MKTSKIHLIMIGLALAIGSATFTNSASYAENKEHKLVLHVDENDPQKMNLALNIIEQSKKEWAKRGDTILVEVVTHGPGLMMLRKDKSPVKKRIGLIAIQQDNVRFSACGNTMKKMANKEGKPIELIPEALKVPAGVVRIMELQEEGYLYVKPSDKGPSFKRKSFSCCPHNRQS